eukprot:1231838-Alexandrium_andersonii.AAC.1
MSESADLGSYPCARWARRPVAVAFAHSRRAALGACASASRQGPPKAVCVARAFPMAIALGSRARFPHERLPLGNGAHAFPTGGSPPQLQVAPRAAALRRPR